MNQDNRSKISYSELTFQFLLGKVTLWAVCKTASEIGITFYISRLPGAQTIVSLSKNPQATFTTYQTTIAIKLAHQWNKPVNQVAGYMAQYLQQLFNGNLDQKNEKTSQVPLSFETKVICRTLTLSLHPKGYVQFHASTITLTVWLQIMQKAISKCNWRIRQPIQEGLGNLKYRNVSRQDAEPKFYLEPRQNMAAQMTLVNIPFTVFHAHARACSILRMAHKMQQIRLRTLLQNRNQREAIVSDTLHPPWMIEHPELQWQALFSASENEHHQRTLATSLLRQLISTLDQVFTTPFSSHRENIHEKKKLRSMIDLSTAFHAFDADFNVCGVQSPSRIMNASSGNNMLDDSLIGGNTAHLSVPSNPYERAQYLSQLGLILMVQHVLHDLLWDIFCQDGNMPVDIPDQL